MLRNKFAVNSKFFNARYSRIVLRKILCRYSTKDGLITGVSKEKPGSAGKKITVVGAGSVGLAAAFNLLAQKISNDVCLVDTNEDKICAEKMDLQQGAVYLNNAKISACSDYTESANSNICIVTAGVRGTKDQSRLDLLQANVDLYKKIIPKLMEYSPNAKLLIITNPVDVMSFVAWKISGLPVNRVFGTGTSLDSARFRFFISERLGVAPTSVHALVIGEHGDSSVPVWSNVNVAGVRLAELNPKMGLKEDGENWGVIHKDVIQAAYKIITLKGYTSWAIGVSAGAIASAILENSNQVLPVSTLSCGFHGIEKDVFLSLPCVVNSNGVQAVIKQKLTPTELKLLQNSAKILGEAQDKVKL